MPVMCIFNKWGRGGEALLGVWMEAALRASQAGNVESCIMLYPSWMPWEHLTGLLRIDMK